MCDFGEKKRMLDKLDTSFFNDGKAPADVLISALKSISAVLAGHCLTPGMTIVYSVTVKKYTCHYFRYMHEEKA